MVREICNEVKNVYFNNFENHLVLIFRPKSKRSDLRQFIFNSLNKQYFSENGDVHKKSKYPALFTGQNDYPTGRHVIIASSNNTILIK
jgi:hypothetical protein